MTPSEFTNALDRGLWVPTNVGIFFVGRGGIFLLRRVKGDAAEVLSRAEEKAVESVVVRHPGGECDVGVALR